MAAEQAARMEAQKQEQLKEQADDLEKRYLRSGQWCEKVARAQALEQAHLIV